MSREIKFRAWDEQARVFHRWQANGERFTNVFWQAVKESSLPVMQFTGLLDKNDAEVYEGDILRCMDMDDENHVIGFENGCFVARLVGIRPDSSSVEAKWRTSFGIGEVIGNIYENPELI